MNRFITSTLDSLRFMLVVFMIVMGSVSCTGEQCPLSFDMRSFEKHSLIDAETWWKCDYPVFGNTKAGEIINRRILSVVASNTPSPDNAPKPASVEQAAAIFIDSFDAFVKSEPQKQMPWQSEVTGQVLFDQPGIVTVSISTYAFTGGAHGMSMTQLLVFDTGSGRQLFLKDIFIPGFEAKLDQLIERRYRQMRGMSEGEPLDGVKGGLFDTRLRHTDNFAVTGSGITFLYNPYDIAPYAAGPIRIHLSFDMIGGVLDPHAQLKPITP